MSEIEKIRLAFIDIAVFSDSSIRGAILTTDTNTRPFEFRITSPIKPTHMQEVLYGASLKGYVYGELICAPLVQATKEKLSLVVVKDESLLTMRPHIQCAVTCINLSDKSRSTHIDFSSDIEQIDAILNPILALEKWDLAEPFLRLQTALQEVHQLNFGTQGKFGG